MQSHDLKVRLPTDLHRWLAHEALRDRRSLNAIVIEAVGLLKATRTLQLSGETHAAAIELAISMARLPEGTAIILKPDRNSHRTEILIRRPFETDYSLLARVHEAEVVFAEGSPCAEGDQEEVS